jgi:hypothetical protein
MPSRKPQKKSVNRLEGISPALKPRFRLFCSVDLVGSTAYKQLNTAQRQMSKVPAKSSGDEDATGSRGPSWFQVILNFYLVFESFLRSEVSSYNQDSETTQHPTLPELEFWKSNGDELLYSFELTSPHQGVQMIAVWKRALITYRKYLRELAPDLDVKSTAWTAGFPLMNTEVVFRETIEQNGDAVDAIDYQHVLRNLWYKQNGNRKGLTRDFIGPSIDTGFRLAEKSTPRKLMVSAELAYLIATHWIDKSIQSDLPIYYSGSEQLKGVLGGRPYPMIWISVDGTSDVQAAEDALLKREPVEREKLSGFCEALFEEHKDYMVRPFICGPTGADVWLTPPLNYFDVLRAREEKIPRERDRAKFQKTSVVEQVGEGNPVSEEEVKRFSQGVLGEADRKPKGRREMRDKE